MEPSEKYNLCYDFLRFRNMIRILNNFLIFKPILTKNVLQNITVLSSDKFSGNVDDCVVFGSNVPTDIQQKVLNHFDLFPNFITSEEEESLIKEIEPFFKRKRYLYDHWDNAIHGYRETEKIAWNADNTNILNRLCEKCFLDNSFQNSFHVLDLAEDGYIKPHVDNVKFCGSVIAGLSLLSDSVMRFTLQKLTESSDNHVFFDVLLSRRSLYVMKDHVRFMFAHEILKKEETFFRGNHYNKKRRISVIARSEPVPTDPASG